MKQRLLFIILLFFNEEFSHSQYQYVLNEKKMIEKKSIQMVLRTRDADPTKNKEGSKANSTESAGNRPIGCYETRHVP